MIDIYLLSISSFVSVTSQEEVGRLMAGAKSNPDRPILQDFLLGSGRKAVVDTLPTFTSNLSNIAKGIAIYYNSYLKLFKLEKCL